MTMSNSLNALATYLTENDGYVLIMHIAPDGDTVGSSLALYIALKNMGKRVQIVCQDKIPEVYKFLPCASDVAFSDKAVRDDIAIAIDCAAEGRLGRAFSLFEAAKRTVSIDHHATNTLFAAHNEIDSEAAATGEVIYRLVRLLPTPISSDIADCIYTAVMTDTGGFANGNTTADSFLTASLLLKHGANPERLNRLVYKTASLQKTKLLGMALSAVELLHNGRIGICVLSQNDLHICKAKAEDTEGIIDRIRDIDTVEVAILMRECADGDYKVSMRSKGVNVADFSQMYGGGGHPCAAGFKTSIPQEELLDIVTTQMKEILGEV